MKGLDVGLRGGPRQAGGYISRLVTVGSFCELLEAELAKG